MILPFIALASQLGHAERLVFTQSGSQIQFSMTATLHDIDGEAQVFSGHLDVNGDESSGEVSIDAKSLTTFMDKRDHKMHTETIQVSRFPNVVYTIHNIEGGKKNQLTDERHQIDSHRGSGEVILHGTLKIARVSREISIPAAYRWEEDALRLIGSTSIQWTDYRLPDPSLLISTLQPQIDIKFSVYASNHP